MTDPKATERELIDQVYYQMIGGGICIPNPFFRNWDRDFIYITPVGYVHEYEVKRTMEDLDTGSIKQRNKGTKARVKDKDRDRDRDRESILKKLEEEKEQVSLFSYVLDFYIEDSDISKIPEFIGVYVIYDDPELSYKRLSCFRKPTRLKGKKLTPEEYKSMFYHLQMDFWKIRLKEGEEIWRLLNDDRKNYK